ncbi:MAG: TolC family outer membrane protein [Alphaproteobacteria bacterium]
MRLKTPPIKMTVRPEMAVLCIATASWLSIASYTVASPAHAQSLTEALVSTYTNNPQLRAARAELRAVDERVNQAKGGYRPNIDAATSVGHEWVNNRRAEGRYDAATGERVFGPIVETTPQSTRLSLTQPVFRGFRTVRAIERAENEVMAQRSRLASTEQNILLNAAVAYLDVYRDQAVVDLTINNERVLQRQLEAAGDRFRVGEITKTDVSQAEARVAGATAGRAASEGNLIQSRATYLRFVGSQPGVLPQPELTLTIASSLEETLSAAMTHDPDVLAAQYLEIASRQSIHEAEGELLPEVNLRSNWTRTLEQGGNQAQQADVYTVLAELRVPLYEQGVAYSKVRQAKQTAGQRRLDIETARRTSSERATQSWQALVTSRAQIVSYKAQVDAANVALEGVRQEATVGSRTVLDVLDQEQEALDARVNLVRAQREEAVAQFRVAAAMGNLTAMGLNLPVEKYDVTKHYDEVKNKLIGVKGDPDDLTGPDTTKQNPPPKIK